MVIVFISRSPDISVVETFKHPAPFAYCLTIRLRPIPPIKFDFLRNPAYSEFLACCQKGIREKSIQLTSDNGNAYDADTEKRYNPQQKVVKKFLSPSESAGGRMPLAMDQRADGSKYSELPHQHLLH